MHHFAILSIFLLIVCIFAENLSKGLVGMNNSFLDVNKEKFWHNITGSVGRVSETRVCVDLKAALLTCGKHI